jgi:hypothetical protein
MYISEIVERGLLSMAANNVQIDISNVSKSYPMGAFKVDALKEIDLEITKGELL